MDVLAELRLAGDIGGTKTMLGLFTPSLGPRQPLFLATYVSRDYPTLEAIVREFLAQYPAKVTAATFGVAGPVINCHARITNLTWEVDCATLSDTLGGAHVQLINDLEAIANYVPALTAEDVAVLQPGQIDPEGTIAVIAPGTGLGQAFLVPMNGDYRAYPSEGGHTDFGPLTPLQSEMWQYLQPRLGHVSYEMVCSGMGLPNIYEFLKATGKAEEPQWLAEELAHANNPTPVIVNAAIREQDAPEICKQTVELFVEILGAESGNLALKVLATGGVYIGGGIPPRILPQLQAGGFMRGFLDKGRFGRLLSNVPVKVILESRAPLYGAARHALGQVVG